MISARKALHAVAALVLASVAACAEEVPHTPPQQLAGSPFHYPEELWDAGVEGETVLRLFVGVEGRVDTVQVEQGSGYDAFDSAAVAGARDLRFEPGLRGEEPVGLWVLLPVQFDLPSTDADTAGTDRDTATAADTVGSTP